MSFELETAANRESLRRVAIDPVSRVEEIGRGRVGKECRSRWSPYH